MRFSFPLRLARWSLLAFFALTILLACRTLDLVTGNPVPPASQLVAQAETRVPETESNVAPPATRTPVPTQEPTEFIPTQESPTEAPPPTEPPPPPTEVPTVPPPPPPTKKPQPTLTPTDSGPTVTPVPTRCAQKYCVVYRGCQPDAGNTVIEGYVYNNGVPENGVAVRVAKEQGAYPLVDDFISGNSAINPGQPDPNTPGYYILQIVAGAPREGNWWVFVVDVRNGTKQVSEAKFIHTNDDPFNSANCQHAFVDFVR